MTVGTTSILDPATLAWWTRTIREVSHWSQEALAEASGLTVRTIQRVEAGEPSSVTTRRALARGLGYENSDVFLDPEFARTVHEILHDCHRIGMEAFEKQFPDVIRLPATRLRSGEQLGQLAEASSAYHYHYDENIAHDAKQTAAEIFDYLKDYGDVDELCSETEKLINYGDLDSLLHDLERCGAVAYYALRSTTIVGKDWPDQTPMPIEIAYVVVAPADKRINEIVAPKKLRLGF